MHFRRLLAAMLTGLVLSPAALAGDSGDREPLSRFEPQVLFQGLIQESDVSLFFDYLRSAMAAAIAGREAPAADELQKRAEALGNELKMRGALAAWLLLSVFEEQAKQLLREGTAPRRSPLPPVAPYIPTAAD